LNATGVSLNSDTSGALYVKPIRNVNNNSNLLYNSTTGEITYGVPSITSFSYNNNASFRDFNFDGGTIYILGNNNISGAGGGPTFNGTSFVSLDASGSSSITNSAAVFICSTNISRIKGRLYFSYYEPSTTTNIITMSIYKISLANARINFATSPTLLYSSSYTASPSTPSNSFSVDLSNAAAVPDDIIYVTFSPSTGTIGQNTRFLCIWSLSLS
jgi:hypothetical protein